MNTRTLAEQWYVPAEIRALRGWIPFAALINLVVAGGEALRGGVLRSGSFLRGSCCSRCSGCAFPTVPVHGGGRLRAW